MSVKNTVDLLDGVQKGADGTVLIEGIDHEGNVRAHIDFAVPFSVKKTVRLVNQVRGEALGEQTVFVCLVHDSETVGEQTEGNKEED